MRKVLVTGASGFVGGHVVHALRARGIAVRCLVRRTSSLEFIKPLDPELVFGDVTDPATLLPAIAGVDAVVHCAGLTKAPSRCRYFHVNEEGCRNLFAACRTRKGQIGRIVHISSLAALGPSPDGRPVTEDASPHPVSDYGESKLAAQRIAQSHMDELPVSIVVPPAIYGPRDVDFCVYFKWVRRGLVPLIGTGSRRLSLIYVKDLAEAVAMVLGSDRASGRTYLVDDGCIQTWTSLANTIGSAMARTPRQMHLPVALAIAMGIIGDVRSRLTGKAWVVNSQKIREFLQTSWTCSSQRIRAELGFCPQYPLERGIQETFSWYRENNWL